MTPDALFQAFGQILADVFGKQGCFRQEPVTYEEFVQIRDRLETLIILNKEKRNANTD
jgi:hypothetical protein